MQIIWSFDEVKKLKENYPKAGTISEIMELFPNRSLSSIQNKAYKLGLKCPFVKKNTMSIRNKKMGRDLSLENLKKIASKYKTTNDFYVNDHSAYITAKRNGVFDEITLHMFKTNESIPQLILRCIVEEIFNKECIYNDRKVIPPLEVDIYFNYYKIGFEYNGLHWHSEDNRFDVKKIRCEKNNILLIPINERIKKNYYKEVIVDIKNELISNLDIINKWTGLSIQIDDVLRIIPDYKKYLLDYHDIENYCKKYNDLNLFRKECPKLYEKIRRRGLLHLLVHMKRSHRIWTIENAKIELENYKCIGELIENDKGLYLYCMRNKDKITLSNLSKKVK